MRVVFIHILLPQKDISIGCPKLTFHILHRTGQLVQGSHPKAEDVAFQVTATALEFGLGFGL